MLLTQLRQFRLTWEILQGNHITAKNIRHLIAAARRTREEYQEPNRSGVSPLLVNPEQGGRARANYQDHMLARTIDAARRFSPYYRAHVPGDTFGVSRETLKRIPLTHKQDIQNYGTSFLAQGAVAALGTSSTGTTGRPVKIWYGWEELEVWALQGALRLIAEGLFAEDDTLQLNVSSRSSVTFRSFLQWQALGMPILPLGIVSPAESLDSLLRQDFPPTLLVTYPSYLAQLVLVARERGIGPGDVHLRRIFCGSEILSPSLAATAQAIFGAPVLDSYGQTETAPLSAEVCSQGHLHYDPMTAFVEVVDLEGAPAGAGTIGTLAVTPYYPWRRTMPLLRYETGDLVRVLPDIPLTCEYAALPATSAILGKREHLIFSCGQIITRRDLVEAIESLPTRPYPARFLVEVTVRGLVLSLLAQAVAGLTLTEVKEHFQAKGLPVVQVRVWPDDFSLNTLCPLRADLLETVSGARGGEQ